jgi:SAM-dependent methyltransferase
MMVKVDLGCGFHESHSASKLDDSVGVDINFQSGTPNTDIPIMADVKHLPLRTKTVKFVKCDALLEHLEDPVSCLNEMVRVMVPGANGSILLPVDAYNVPQILKRFIKEFPFSIPWVLQKLWRTLTLWKIPGMRHVSQINARDLERWFNVDHERIQYKLRLHKWFVHYGAMVPLIKLGLLKRRLTVPEYAEMVIPLYNDPLRFFDWVKICEN